MALDENYYHVASRPAANFYHAPGRFHFLSQTIPSIRAILAIYLRYFGRADWATVERVIDDD
jgi:hypothetical protein